MVIKLILLLKFIISVRFVDVDVEKNLTIFVMSLHDFFIWDYLYGTAEWVADVAVATLNSSKIFLAGDTNKSVINLNLCGG